ncbi:MAG: hypothetical protein ABSE46_02575 [Terracidiphilus sp.]
MGAPVRYRVFVDVGAADGYYAVGLLFSGRVERSVAFETIPEYRAAIAQLANKNGVADKITILGTASGRFADVLVKNQITSRETMFLIDIEGAEFELLTKEVFTALSDSLIVVETHAHIYADLQGEMNRLIEKASATHSVTAWYPGAQSVDDQRTRQFYRDRSVDSLF